MKFRVFACLAVLSLAALSPAPIRDIHAKGHEIAPHSQEQVAKEQQFNGTQGVVGEVPIKTLENGTTVDPTVSDEKAKGIVAEATPVTSDPAAVKALTQAQKDLAAANADGPNKWLIGLMVFGVGFGLFHAVRLGLEKVAPMPAPIKVTGSKPSGVLDLDEKW